MASAKGTPPSDLANRPPVNRGLRDSLEYYREPPAMTQWTWGLVTFWIVCFLGLVVGGYMLLRQAFPGYF